MKVRQHFSITQNQLSFLQTQFVGISQSEALRRIIDEAIVRYDWSPPDLTPHPDLVDEGDEDV